MKLSIASSLAIFSLPCLVSAQLSGDVGPSTSASTKSASKTCNVLDYGGVASTTSDLGPPLASAWAACKENGMVYIPSGSYGMSTFVTLTGGSATGIQLDGQIYRTGSTASGNMIAITDTTDFEFFSSTSKGAIQGYGYVFHAEGEYGPRILRLSSVTDFSVHDVALVDAGAFHLVLDTATNGEVYNTIIRGGNEGGLDGIDVWGTNVWVHDVEVSNKDECVTIKSPSDHILVENIFCNWSGGCAIGSLGADTNISYITYNNIYTWTSNQMFMIKSYGGSGSVSNCHFENFIGHGNAYSLDINGYWSGQTEADGDGVLFTDMTFANWYGTCADGAERGPVYIICPDGNPCDGIIVEDFAIWTESGDTEWYKCQSAYGTGVCLKDSSSHVSCAAVTSTISAAPSGYSVATMPGQLSTLALTESIAIPTIPTTFYPGATPYSALLG